MIDSPSVFQKYRHPQKIDDFEQSQALLCIPTIAVSGLACTAPPRKKPVLRRRGWYGMRAIAV